MATNRQLQSHIVDYVDTLPSSNKKEVKECFAAPVDQIFPKVWSTGLHKQISLPELNLDLSKKGSRESEILRTEGNRLFKSRDHRKALIAFNYAVLVAPHPTNVPDRPNQNEDVFIFPFASQYRKDEYTELALAHANRSAVLLELGRNEDAVADIKDALFYGYEKQHKLFERKVKCLFNLGKYDVAEYQAARILQSINSFSMDNKERTTLQTSLLKLLKKCKESPTNNKSAELDQRQPSSFPTIKRSRNSDGMVSTSVGVRSDASIGRHLVAEQNISPGEVLMIEESHSYFLTLDRTLRSHCCECCRPAPVPLPCVNCSLAVYCSRECRRISLSKKGGHQAECSVLPLLVALQLDMDAYLAFRVMTASGVSAIREYCSRRQDGCSRKDVRDLLDMKQGEYEDLMSLEGHEDRPSKLEEKIEVWVASVIVVKLLALCPSFWDDISSFEFTDINEKDIILIGKELMYLILKIQCNAHCIKELDQTIGDHPESGRYKDIGYALNGKMSLMNHSCNPNTHISTSGKKKVLYALGAINKGQEITITYGERYVSHKKAVRQENLLKSYFFKCQCIACKNDWPTFSELNDASIKSILRCGACSGPVDGADYRCRKCKLQHVAASKKKQNSQKKGKNQSVYDGRAFEDRLSRAWSEYTSVRDLIRSNKAACDDQSKVEHLIAVMDSCARHPNKLYVDAQETLTAAYDLLCLNWR